jgi:hypothetical protein
MSNNIPTQSIPLSEKTQKWREQTVEAYIEQANFKLGANSYRQYLLKLYDYYNGKIDPADYHYVLEPYGKSRDNYPAKIRNFPLIKPSIDLLIGEKSKRPFNFSIIISSSDVVTIKEQAKNEAVLENMYQWFVNKLNDSGFNTEMESEEVQLPHEIEQIFDRNWKDNRALMAQKALNYLIPYVKWHEENHKAWFDFLVSGYVMSERGIENDEPFYRTLNPVDVDFDKDPNIYFIEDGNWAVVRELVSRHSIVDKFRKKLSKEDIERLQNPINSNRDIFFWYNREEQIFYDQWDSYTEIATVYWKSLTKVGFRTYIDEYGDTLEEVVGEDYQYDPMTDINLEWDWINEVWEGYRIDGDIYLDIQPYKHQRSSIDNPSKCKLPINGRTYSNRNSTNISLVEIGIPYQLSYNIFKFRLENAIAKSKDILAMMDINLIPEGWTMDKFMYMVEATGIAWVNYQKEGVQFNPQHQGVLDLSIKTITQYIELLRFILEEWERISGVSRQRMGEMGQYEGKGVAEQSIIQSSHITEDYYRKFSFFEQRDLQCLIDYSQLAWIDGKKANYVMPDGTQQFLDIDPDTYTHAEFGVFVNDASKEVEKLNQLRGLGQASIQNGVPMSIVAEMIESDSFVEIKDKINQAEKHMEELNQQAQEMEQQMVQAEQENKQMEREHESIENEKDRQNKIELELIKQQAKQADTEVGKTMLEERKLQLEEKIKSRELSEKERSNKANEKLKEKEIKVKAKAPSKPK